MAQLSMFGPVFRPFERFACVDGCNLHMYVISLCAITLRILLVLLLIIMCLLSLSYFAGHATMRPRNTQRTH